MQVRVGNLDNEENTKEEFLAENNLLTLGKPTNR